MPFITIDSNSPVKADKKQLAMVMEIVAEVLNKPKDYIIVKINTEKMMMCGSNPDTIGALIEVKSIGYNGKIGDLAARLTNFCNEILNADPRSVAIHFVDMPATNAAQNGVPFA